MARDENSATTLARLARANHPDGFTLRQAVEALLPNAEWPDPIAIELTELAIQDMTRDGGLASVGLNRYVGGAQ